MGRKLRAEANDEAKNNFPITPTTTGTVREGYMVGEMTANPEKVTLRGPKKVINSINKVVAETTDGMVQSSAAVQDLSRMAQELRRVMEGLK